MATPRPSELTRSDDGRARDDAADHGLLLVAGEGTITTFPLLRDETVIGRGADCDVVIDHPTLSRRHAILRHGPPTTVEDLGSKNGTRVARRLVAPAERAPLPLGESFHIGRFSFVVVRAPRTAHSARFSASDELRVIDPTVEGATSLVREIARSGVGVLLLGETGVGKEVLAETLHKLSERPGPFVCINCAAISPALFESELFGHEKGAFTGAEQARPGLLEAAHHGTVLLDEVGDLSAAAQAKLLRAIETKAVVRVGAVKPLPLDVRFVAATNRDLAGEVSRGQFRADLYFRLDGVTLAIPPLRERRARIAPLALELLRQSHAKSPSTTPPRMAPDLLPRLEAHDWPGNVRELKAALERALLLARGGAIAARHLALAATAKAKPPVADATPVVLDSDESEARRRIVDALDACAGNQTRAAKMLGISRATLVTKLALYRIPRPRR